jgi:hypothetical protein
MSVAARAAEILADLGVAIDHWNLRDLRCVELIDCRAREHFPLASGCEGVEALVGTPMKGLMRRTNDAAKVNESLFVYLISMEQVGVIAEVSKKPMQLPQGSLGAIQPADKGSVGRGPRL